MAAKQEYIEYICGKIYDIENIRIKIFGEFMGYHNNNPVIINSPGLLY